jgi:hypothetical protein
VIGANARGLYGIGMPSLRAGTELLLAGTGLLVITPLWAFATAGLVTLWQSGYRAESAAVGVIAGTFLLYNAAYWLPFGGGVPGPRFLVPMLAFLALPLAAAWRALPLPAIALAVVSAVITTMSLVADPLTTVEDPGIWLGRLRRGDEVSGTVLHWLWDGSAMVQILPVLVLVAAAFLLALAVTPRPRVTVHSLVLAAAVLVGWRILYVATPVMLEVDRATDDRVGMGAAIAALLAVGGAVILLGRGVWLAALAGVVVAPLLWPRYAAHTTLSLMTVVVALMALALCVFRVRARRRASA